VGNQVEQLTTKLFDRGIGHDRWIGVDSPPPVDHQPVEPRSGLRFNGKNRGGQVRVAVCRPESSRCELVGV
jgi:hypothetical protein